METVFAQHPEIAQWIIGILLTIIAWLSIQYFTGVKKRMKAIEDDVDEVKDNYISRFENLTDRVSEVKGLLVEVGAKLDAQVSLCRYVQDQKKVNH